MKNCTQLWCCLMMQLFFELINISDFFISFPYSTIALLFVAFSFSLQVRCIPYQFVLQAPSAISGQHYEWRMPETPHLSLRILFWNKVSEFHARLRIRLAQTVNDLKFAYFSLIKTANHQKQRPYSFVWFRYCFNINISSTSATTRKAEIRKRD